jgi:hypothetical protein
MYHKLPEYKKIEYELYDRIREITEEFNRLGRGGKDTTDTLQRLEAVLEEFWKFRQEYKDRF